VLVNRGWISREKQDRKARGETLTEGVVAVSGVIEVDEKVSV
jgi:cytochrome oxidase assembly protein ShyY1